MSILVCMYHLQNYLMEFSEIWYWRSTVKLGGGNHIGLMYLTF